MSWQSAMSSPDIAMRDSPLESRRFGHTFSRVEVSLAVHDPSALDVVRSFLREDVSDVVVVRYPAVHVGWFAELLDPGRALISADTLTYWSLDVGTGRPPSTNPAVTARVADLPAQALVEDLVSDMFAGYGNHYLANPLLDPSAALAGYVEWAQRSAADDTAVLLHRDGDDVGLATMETGAAVCEIQLAGIRADFQSLGLYGHLLAACEDAARAAGATQLVISTQAHNANVQRAWARYGFVPVGSLHTVHAVRAELV